MFVERYLLALRVRQHSPRTVDYCNERPRSVWKILPVIERWSLVEVWLVIAWSLQNNQNDNYLHAWCLFGPALNNKCFNGFPDNHALTHKTKELRKVSCILKSSITTHICSFNVVLYSSVRCRQIIANQNKDRKYCLGECCEREACARGRVKLVEARGASER